MLLGTTETQTFGIYLTRYQTCLMSLRSLGLLPINETRKNKECDVTLASNPECCGAISVWVIRSRVPGGSLRRLPALGPIVKNEVDRNCISKQTGTLAEWISGWSLSIRTRSSDGTHHTQTHMTWHTLPTDLFRSTGLLRLLTRLTIIVYLFFLPFCFIWIVTHEVSQHGHNKWIWLP